MKGGVRCRQYGAQGLRRPTTRRGQPQTQVYKRLLRRSDSISERDFIAETSLNPAWLGPQPKMIAGKERGGRKKEKFLGRFSTAPPLPGYGAAGGLTRMDAKRMIFNCQSLMAD